MAGDGTAHRLPGRRVRAVGQDRRPRRRDRRAGPGAGPRAGRCRSTGSSMSSCRAIAASRRPIPPTVLGERTLEVPDPRARTGTSSVTIIDVAGDGYRLRLVDHPPAFDRDGFYGDADGDYRRQRLAIRAVRAGGARGAARRRSAGRRPAPARLAGRPGGGLPRPALRRRPDHRAGRRSSRRSTTSRITAGPGTRRSVSLGLRPGDGAPGQNADGIDLLAAAIEAAEIVNTVSPTYAREALTPEFGMGLDGLLRSRGDRFIGILNGLDTDGLGSRHGRGPRRAATRVRTGPARRRAGPTCWSASASTRPTTGRSSG